MSSDFWDERYAGEVLAYGSEPNDFVASVAPQLPPGPVLCLAEGQGRNAVFLAAQRGLGPVTAVDQSPVGLQVAQRLAKERGVVVNTVVADLSTWDLGGPWSTIVVVWGHFPPPIQRRVYAGVRDALAPGGAFVLEAYTPDQVKRGTGGPPVPELMVTLAAVKTALPGWEFRVGQEIERMVHEGAHHHGLSDVVQILAFKPG